MLTIRIEWSIHTHFRCGQRVKYAEKKIIIARLSCRFDEPEFRSSITMVWNSGLSLIVRVLETPWLQVLHGVTNPDPTQPKTIKLPKKVGLR